MAAEVWETPFPERAREAAAGKISGGAGAQVHALGGGGGTDTERRDRILQLAEEALGRAARDLAAAKAAQGWATGQDAKLRAGEAYDAAELCCDRLLLADLLLGQPRAPPLPGADDDDDGELRVRVADGLEKAMGVAEDCAALVRRARSGNASGTGRKRDREMAAGKIAGDAQQRHCAGAQADAVGGGSTATEQRDKTLQLAEEALGRAAKDLTVAKSAQGCAAGPDAKLRAGEAYDAAELCCDRLLLVDLLLGADDGFADDDGGNLRVRVADALEKAMGVAEDCASLVRRARSGNAPGAPAT